MVALQAGDERALEALMGRWKSPLYAFLSRRAGHAFADDLFQEAWLRVVRARDRFDPRRRFSTWLFQIANNLCRDRARRRDADARRRDAVAHEPAPAPPDPARRTEARLDAERRLAVLPDHQREVMVLRYYHDLGEREMAELLGVPRGTVKSRLHAAVRALREAEQADLPPAGAGGEAS
jgi:RNA polymerase sigma-70 factor (ECF subfamily)